MEVYGSCILEILTQRLHTLNPLCQFGIVSHRLVGVVESWDRTKVVIRTIQSNRSLKNRNYKENHQKAGDWE